MGLLRDYTGRDPQHQLSTCRMPAAGRTKWTRPSQLAMPASKIGRALGWASGTRPHRLIRAISLPSGDFPQAHLIGCHIPSCLRHKPTARAYGTGLLHGPTARAFGTGLQHQPTAPANGTGLRHRCWRMNSCLPPTPLAAVHRDRCGRMLASLSTHATSISFRNDHIGNTQRRGSILHEVTNLPLVPLKWSCSSPSCA